MINCEVCGNSNIVKQDGLFVCQSCGIKYTLDEIKKLMQSCQNICDKTPKCDMAVSNEIKEERHVGIGDLVFYGNYRFYENEDDVYPIQWLIIDEDEESFLLFSRYLIDYVQFNTFKQQRSDVPPIVDSKGAYRYVWHNSSLREWLNSVFFDEAFDDEEKAGIISKKILFPQYTIKNSYSFPNSSESLPETHDKVFIPSDKDFLTYIRAIRIAACFLELEITPFAELNASGKRNVGDKDYWGRNQSLLSRRNNARLVGSYEERKASEYAYLRPMICVKKEAIQQLLYNYDSEFFDYYLETKKSYLAINEKDREFCKRKDIEEMVAKSEISFEHSDGIRMGSEDIVTETSLCENAYDAYVEDDEDHVSDYDPQRIIEETWRETHLNPYGTEDVGDGYIDRDGNYFEY